MSAHQAPLPLRCLRALFDEAQRTIDGGDDGEADGDGMNNDATAIEGTTASKGGSGGGGGGGGDSPTCSARSGGCSRGAEQHTSSSTAGVSRPAHARRTVTTRTPMHDDGSVEHMRWLARSPRALRATRRFFSRGSWQRRCANGSSQSGVISRLWALPSISRR